MFNPVHWRQEIFVDLHNDDFLWACMVCPSFEFEDLELLQLNDPFLCCLLCMGIADWMGGSETIHLAFTHWVRGGYFLKVPTKVPTG